MNDPARTSAASCSQPSHAEPLLEVRDLHVHFPIHSGLLQRRTGVVRAVNGVTFSIARGETLGIVGESGSGKTTVGRAILRLVHATGGSVVFDGHDVLRARGEELRSLRRSMQIVFQDPGSSLNPRLRVGTILCEPMLVHGLVHSADEARARAIELLDRCGMPAWAFDRYPHEFSGGQRQRIGVARALSVKPRFMVCDEPTSALDVSVQAQIINLLKDLQRDLGLAYLFISHDMSVMQHVCTRLAVMHNGRIVEQGPRDTILTSPEHPYTRSLLASVPVADPTARTHHSCRVPA